MTDTSKSQLIINRLSATQFNSAVPSNTELYMVDPEFTGNKGLMTNPNGEIVERPEVTDLTSTTVTLANAVSGTTYKYGTLTSLTVTANDTSNEEITIYFTASSTSIAVNFPGTIEYIGSAPVFETGKKYVISILNNMLISGEVV